MAINLVLVDKELACQDGITEEIQSQLKKDESRDWTILIFSRFDIDREQISVTVVGSIHPSTQETIDFASEYCTDTLHSCYPTRIETPVLRIKEGEKFIQGKGNGAFFHRMLVIGYQSKEGCTQHFPYFPFVEFVRVTEKFDLAVKSTWKLKEGRSLF